MDVTVHCAETLGKLRHFWHSTGFTPANLLLDADMRQAMAYAGAVPHGGITWVRIHYLLELVTAVGLGGPNPTYDWSRLDTALEVLVRNGLKPFFELMGFPGGTQAFADYTDLAQAEGWRQFVCELARHLIERFGGDEVRSWLFETWNEPDVGFWRQGDEAFLVYYDACSAGLADADPELRLGGPGTCRNLSSTLKAFLAHCHTGTNIITGHPAHRPAFISVHEKGVRSHREDLTPDTMGIVEREVRIIDYIRTHHPALADLPFANNECDPQVGWGTIHTWRARPYYAALVAKVINQHLLKLVDAKGVDYLLLSNDNGFLGTWGHRTLLARFSELDHIDHGQADGQRDAPRLEEDQRRRRFELIKKPVLNVMTLLALLGDERCAVTGAFEAAGPLGVLATRHGDGQIAVLLYNSDDRSTVGGGATRVTLCVEDMPFERAMLTRYGIGGDDDDPFNVWERMGAPDHPNAAQFEALRHAQELHANLAPREVEVVDGRWTCTLDLDLPSVTLLLLTVDPGAAPAKVTGLKAERYEGMEGEGQVLLTWDAADSRALGTYEVLFTPEANSPLPVLPGGGKVRRPSPLGEGDARRLTLGEGRLNPVDLLDTAFLVSIPEPGTYQVRAVDYWERHGELSNPVII
jgi:L-iduronidase